MRRSKGRITGPLKPGCTNVFQFPYVSVSPSRMESPGVMSVGSSALALELDVKQEEAIVDKPDWPSRPEGVSDDVLYEAWHRLRTPVASVAGSKKKDGVIRRVNHSSSGIHRPKAYSPTNIAVYMPSAFVVPLRKHIEGIAKSAEARYYSTKASRVTMDLINPKAQEYVSKCFEHQVSVWAPVAVAIKAKAIADHNAYSFDERLQYRQMEFADFPPPQVVEEYLAAIEVGSVDASVATNDSNFVGPIKIEADRMLATRDDVPLRSWKAYNDTEIFKHIAKRNELTATFDSHYTHLKEVDMLMKHCALFRKNKWRASPEFQRKLRAANEEWNNLQGKAAQLAASRVVQYQYRLKAMRKKGKSAPALQLMTLDSWLSAYAKGVNLPVARVDFEPKKPSPLAYTTAALYRVYDKVVADCMKAKAELVIKKDKALQLLFGDQKYEQAASGLFLPTKEVAFDFGW